MVAEQPGHLTHNPSGTPRFLTVEFEFAEESMVAMSDKSQSEFYDVKQRPADYKLTPANSQIEKELRDNLDSGRC